LDLLPLFEQTMDDAPQRNMALGILGRNSLNNIPELNEERGGFSIRDVLWRD
jgi:hypothetical protein